MTWPRTDRLLWIAAVLAVLAGVAMPTRGASGAEPPTLLVVFDGSGSFWGQFEGERRSKLAAARESVRDGLARVGRDTRIGVMSYGHRRAGDCGDVEVAVRPETGAGDRVMAFLDKINPRGRGPITNALREASRHIGPGNGAASVLLIHDDPDNCQLDPCDALADLRQAHPRVVVHVVSVGMPREAAQRMQCLTKGTGGRHYEVASSGELATAIIETMRVAAEPVASAPVPPEPKPAVRPRPAAPKAADAAPAGPGLQLGATLATGRPLIDRAIRWRIARRESGSSVPVWEGDSPGPRLELATGTYEVEAWLGFVRSRGEIQVTEGAAQKLVLALGAGQITLPTLVTADGGAGALAKEAILAVQRIDPGSESTVFQRGLEPEITVLPGNYVLSLTIGSVRLERTVGVRAGEASAFDATLMLGAVELDAVAAAGGSRVEGAVLALFQDDPDVPQGRREVWRSASNPATAILPAGNYYAIARKGSVEARDRIVVRPGEAERRSLVIEAARLTVATSLAGNRIAISEPVSHRLERLDSDQQISVLSNANATFRVAAGRYRLETRVGLGNAVAVREVELRPGARDQVSLELPAGQLRLRWLDAAGAPIADVGWEIRDASGRVVWAANQTEARPLLLAGRYAVRAEIRDRRIEQMVDVRAGEIRPVDMTAP